MNKITLAIVLASVVGSTSLIFADNTAQPAATTPAVTTPAGEKPHRKMVKRHKKMEEKKADTSAQAPK